MRPVGGLAPQAPQLDLLQTGEDVPQRLGRVGEPTVQATGAVQLGVVPDAGGAVDVRRR